MKHLYRRSLLIAILAVGACAGSTPNVAQAVADAQIVVTGVQSAYATLKQFDPALTNTATDAQVQAIFARLPDALAQLQAATTPAAQASGLRAVEADVNGVINLAAGIVSDIPGCGAAAHVVPCPVPPAVVLALQAAEVLLPIIESVANQLVPATTGAPAAPAALVSRMSPDQARATLVAAQRR